MSKTKRFKKGSRPTPTLGSGLAANARKALLKRGSYIDARVLGKKKGKK